MVLNVGTLTHEAKSSRVVSLFASLISQKKTSPRRRVAPFLAPVLRAGLPSCQCFCFLYEQDGPYS